MMKVKIKAFKERNFTVFAKYQMNYQMWISPMYLDVEWSDYVEGCN